MFFALQIICYLTIYDVIVPANASIFLEQFTNLIEFQVLNPQAIVRVITSNPDFNLVDFILRNEADN